LRLRKTGRAIPKAFAGGVAVRDRFKPYDTMKDVAHALCNEHNLRELKALRLSRFKSDVLGFVFDFIVAFTNTLAEHALRTMKVKMKISGGFRTGDGAKTFAILRSRHRHGAKTGLEHPPHPLTPPARNLLLSAR
jgi:hypothetical protein